MKETNQLPPRLLVSHGKDNQKQTVYSLSKKRFYPSNIPEFANKCILTCGYGWLVLADYDTCLGCLWNPSTVEIIELNILDWQYLSTFGKCVLSKPPTDSDCHILLLCDCGQHLAFSQLEVNDDDKLVDDDDDDKLVIESVESNDLTLFATSLDGKIYFYGILIATPCLAIADFIGKTKLELRPIFEENILFHSIRAIWSSGKHRYYLIKSECGRELLLVVELMWCSCFYYDGLLLKIYRVDMTQNKFVELENIGNQLFFSTIMKTKLAAVFVFIPPPIMELS